MAVSFREGMHFLSISIALAGCLLIEVGGEKTDEEFT